jgi:NAD(P)-dependent dehydrogenase (short-subunit alcohol dehydrogenase family)
MTGKSAATLDGKVAIVTGAGRGLGRVMALGLLDAGARVAAAELDMPALDETQGAVEQRGADDRFFGIVADITHDDSGPKIVRATTERFGRLDILVNNAGINISLFRPAEVKDTAKFWEVTSEQFRSIVDVNVVGTFLMTRAALVPMLKRRWGRIINVTTSLDMMWRAEMQPYGGSKAANEAHLLAMALDLAGTGVTANVLVPGGAANTRMVPPAMAPDRAKLIAPEVMVAPLIWLCSNASDGVTGQRFIAARWDEKLPPAEAAQKAGAPAAWQQLGRQAIMPDRVH